MTAVAEPGRAPSTTSPRIPAAEPTRPSPVLVFGSPSPAALALARSAAEQARLPLVTETTLADADHGFEKSHPSAILVDATPEAAERACLHFRYDPLLANVPILVAVDAVTDLGFEEGFGWGADDLVKRGDSSMLVRRLRGIATAGAVPRCKRRGLAVVADADRRRRVLCARVLRNAGYGVTFAVDADEAIREAGQSGVELVVSSASLEGGGAESLPARARRAGVTAPWVVAASPKEAPRARASAAGVPDVAVHDAFGPPENVLFVANELMRRGVADARASARVLFGTTVRFRAPGGEQDEVGYSYNVSGGGLYVRTLAPLPRGSDAWLELCPPRSDRRVRLEARVVWTRGFGPNDAATVPPGFGVQITGGSMGDLERFARGYQTFAAEMLAR
jgi:CheY-like chemotaxis protein